MYGIYLSLFRVCKVVWKGKLIVVGNNWYKQPEGLEGTNILRIEKNEGKLLTDNVLHGKTKNEKSSETWKSTDLASDWRFGKGNWKSYSCSTELEYKNKSIKIKGWQKPGRLMYYHVKKQARMLIKKLCIVHVVSGCGKLAQKEY